MPDSSSRSMAGHGAFPVTRWSVVDAAAEGDTSVAGEALEQLCREYWYPLYAFARRNGQSVDDAKDLTQGFFAALLDKGWLESADRQKGKLRTFLLTAFRRFMAKEWRAMQAQSRGGRVAIVPLEDEGAENRYAAENATETPESAVQIARAYTNALRDLDIDRALELWNEVGDPSPKRREQMLRNTKELVDVYAQDPDRLSTFSEWHNEDRYAVARLAPPKGKDDTRSLYLILSKAANGWGIVDMDDIRADQSLREKLDHLLDR